MGVWRALPILAASWYSHRAQGAACPGTIDVKGYGPVSLVPTGWNTPSDGLDVAVLGSRQVIPHMGGRAYFADSCNVGVYDHSTYAAPNLLGKTMRYTTDMSGSGCGCNAAFYLTSMRQNTHPSQCNDFYCDANNVCGESCAEIDIQEANERAWHSTLHTASDHSGVGKGYGGGGEGWNGPRDWTADEYGPGAKCIDTTMAFNVAVSFPVDSRGSLVAMEVTLSQEGHSCPLTVRLDDYKGLANLSTALAKGMTPIVSYWSDDDMLWMDGKGKDKKGPCAHDNKAACTDSVKFYDFSLEAMAKPHRTPQEETSQPVEYEFDCDAGYSNMALAWSEGKRKWCCINKGRGCNFDCDAGYSNREMGWSEAKKSWCCHEKNRGCPPEEPKMEVMQGGGPVMRGGAGGFCCLAAQMEGDFCGTCYPGARASLGSHCGDSMERCTACGGRATWCSAEEAQPQVAQESPAEDGEGESEDGEGESEGFCCLAAARGGDFCGTCFSGAKVESESHCGGSASRCRACGGGATWCPHTATAGAPDVEADQELQQAVVEERAEETTEGFCCLAAPPSGDFCGNCFPGGRARPESHCGGSKASCESCGGRATWCAASSGSAPIFSRASGQIRLRIKDSSRSSLPSGFAKGSEATVAVGGASPLPVQVVSIDHV